MRAQKMSFFPLAGFWLFMLSMYFPVEGVMVHFSSPVLQDGVWRTTVDIDRLLRLRKANVRNVAADLTCATLGHSTKHNGFRVRSLSYDESARRTLIQINEQNNIESTAVSISTCSSQTSRSCKEQSPGYREVMNRMWTKDYGFIQPLASANNSLYFVYTPTTRHVRYFGYRDQLQLRKMNDDAVLPTNKYSSSLDIDNISTVLANISVEGRWLQAGYSLIAVSAEGDDLVFLTVIRSMVSPRPEGADPQFRYILVGVYMNEAKVLHMTEDIAYKWYGNVIVSEGGVSYKDGTLCLTVADSILCGSWSPDQPFTPPADVEAVLVPGQASQVCKFKGSLETYGNLTTGVAIAETPQKDGRLALFFGCFCSIFGQGGLGLLVKDPTETNIRGLLYSGRPMPSGAMFVTPDNLCDAADEVRRLLQGLEPWR